MNSLLGPLGALASSFTWAAGTVVYSKLTRNHSPFTINLARALAATPFFILAIFLAGVWTDFEILTVGQVTWLTISIISSYAIGDVLFLMSTRTLDVPTALAIASSFPIWSALAGAIFLGEQLSPLRYGALILVVLSVMVVILSDARPQGTEKKKPGYWKGVFLALGCSIFWCVNTYANAKVGNTISSFTSNLIRMLIAIGVCQALLWNQRRQIKKSNPSLYPKFLSGDEIKRYGWIFALEAFGGSFCFVYGLTHAPLAVASALSSLAPAISVPIAVVFGKQRISPIKIAAVMTVVLGVCALVGLE